MRTTWTEQELYTLSVVYPTQGVVAACKELGRSKHSVIGMARKQGITTGRYWTPEQDAVLRKLHPDHRNEDIARIIGKTKESVEHRSLRLGLKKDCEFLREIVRINAQHPKAVAKRFRPGNVPFNKGVKGWDAGGRCRETQFKTGHKPHTWNPVGHERITKDGYLERKMRDTGETRKDYVPVHHLVWMEANGPIPRDHIVVFKNGDKTDIRLENLECISRKENMRRNSIHNWPEELVSIQQHKNWLIRRIRQKEGHYDHAEN